MKNKKLISFFLLILLMSSCGINEKNSMEDSKKACIYEEFDLFQMKGQKKITGKTEKFPYVEVSEKTDSIFLNIFYSKEKIKYILFKKNKEYWEVSKYGVDRAYSKLRKTESRIVVLNDSIVIVLSNLFNMTNSSIVDINGIQRYKKIDSSLFSCAQFDYTKIRSSNLLDLKIWDSSFYESNTLHPWYMGTLNLQSQYACERFNIFNPQRIGATKTYIDTIRHGIGSASLIYYIFRGW